MKNLIVFLLAIFPFLAESSQLVGGTATVRYVSFRDGLHEIELTYLLGWEYDETAEAACTREGTNMLGHEGDGWFITTAENSFYIPETRTFCDSYDEERGWAVGKGVRKSRMAEPSGFGLKFMTGRVSTKSGNHTLPISNIDFRPRSDTNLPNNLPITVFLPVVRLFSGCPYFVQIPTTDLDLDTVHCRFASPKECGAECGPYPPFLLDSDSCTLTFSGDGGAQSYYFSIIIEDRPRTEITLDNRTVTPDDAIGGIPLDFMIKVEELELDENSTIEEDCRKKPTDCSELSQQYIETDGVQLCAIPGVDTNTIEKFIILGPSGISKSEIRGGDRYYVDIKGLQQESHRDIEPICYHAVESNGRESDVKCFYVQKNAEYIENPCSRSCWVLADDRKTCIPDIELGCNGTEISVKIKKCAVPLQIFASRDGILDEIDEKCVSTGDSMNHILDFRSTDCGTYFNINDTTLSYHVNVWFWNGEEYKSTLDGAVVVQGELHRLGLTCHVPTSVDISSPEFPQRSFIPNYHIKHNGTSSDPVAEGLTNLQLQFDFYRTNTFADAFESSEYPVEYYLGDNIYFGIQMAGQKDLELFTEDCTASVQAGANPNYHYILKDGCQVDKYTKKYTSRNPLRNLFSVEAFGFKEKLFKQSFFDEVTIECKVRICQSTALNSRCRRGCVSGRSKRSHVYIIDEANIANSTAIEHIRSMPIKIFLNEKRPESPPAENSSSGQEFNWALVAFGVVLALLLLIVLLLFFLFTRRRRKARKNADEQQE